MAMRLRVACSLLPRDAHTHAGTHTHTHMHTRAHTHTHKHKHTHTHTHTHTLVEKTKSDQQLTHPHILARPTHGSFLSFIALGTDVNRTLCTTRSGATPLPASGRVKHVVDAELKAAVAMHPSAHVVTRNSHRDDIERFLAQEGLGGMRVHVVPKKMPKGKYILDHIVNPAKGTSQEAPTASAATAATGPSTPSSPPSEAANTLMGSNYDHTSGGEREQVTCLFVDDDVRELVSDAWLREDPGVHRALFVRAL
jgi:hypothetical protein